jgi:hypothetical protein
MGCLRRGGGCRLAMNERFRRYHDRSRCADPEREGSLGIGPLRRPSAFSGHRHHDSRTPWPARRPRSGIAQAASRKSPWTLWNARPTLIRIDSLPWVQERDLLLQAPGSRAAPLPRAGQPGQPGPRAGAAGQPACGDRLRRIAATRARGAGPGARCDGRSLRRRHRGCAGPQPAAGRAGGGRRDAAAGGRCSAGGGWRLRGGDGPGRQHPAGRTWRCAHAVHRARRHRRAAQSAPEWCRPRRPPPR